MTRYKNKKSTVRADAPLVSQSTDIFRPNGFWRLQVSDDAEYRKTCAGQNLECSSIQRASESLAKKKEADECEEERRKKKKKKTNEMGMKEREGDDGPRPSDSARKAAAAAAARALELPHD